MLAPPSYQSLFTDDRKTGKHGKSFKGRTAGQTGQAAQVPCCEPAGWIGVLKSWARYLNRPPSGAQQGPDAGAGGVRRKLVLMSLHGGYDYEDLRLLAVCA